MLTTEAPWNIIRPGNKKAMLQMKAVRFRVQNFRNIDDSGWVPLDQVTNFVGRNESGKTALLKALHKFNPSTPEPFDAQSDFPRDRYARDYLALGPKAGGWPVCSIAFQLPHEVKTDIAAILGQRQEAPKEVVVTRCYDQSLSFDYEPVLEEKSLPPAALANALVAFASAARRLESPTPELEDETAKRRGELASWATEWRDKLTGVPDLGSAEGIDLLERLRSESECKGGPQTADMIEALQQAFAPILELVRAGSVLSRVNKLVAARLPVLIYFENYGVLDSAIWLPRFLEDRERTPGDPRVRTASAMFRHVGLDPAEITEFGGQQTEHSSGEARQPNHETIAKDQRRKEERAIRLNSASVEITRGFSQWWSQRRHKIRYHADGDYFRIWVADDLRSGVEIELEARSKGFQWFFSFYLVFLVESEGGHKDAILLLDEPGLHLHPTAQQELIGFFEKLSEKNQLLYTTHSPFLVDGERLHRVRPVAEDDTGHSYVSVETWPKDRDTIFPMQAAAGYALAQGLFRHRKNLLVESLSDYYYIHALSQQCRAVNRASLPEDVYVTPCGGARLVSQFASLFLGEAVRPLILLDGDDAGRVQRDALMRELYFGHGTAILLVDEVFGRAGADVEIEDCLGEEIVLPALNALTGRTLSLTDTDRSAGSLPRAVEAAARREGERLPDGWKAPVAVLLVSEWAQGNIRLPEVILERAELLFAETIVRFEVGAAE